MQRSGFLLILPIVAVLTAPAAADVFRDSKFDYRFTYPDGWVVTEQHLGDSRVMIVNRNGPGGATCGVIAYRLDDDDVVSVEEAKARTDGLYTKDFMRKVLKESIEVDVTDVREGDLDGWPTGFALAEHTLVDGQDRVPLKLTYATTVTDRDIITIMCAVEESKYYASESQFRRIISSMDFDD